MPAAMYSTMPSVDLGQPGKRLESGPVDRYIFDTCPRFSTTLQRASGAKSWTGPFGAAMM
jgi:hypothetical protein